MPCLFIALSGGIHSYAAERCTYVDGFGWWTVFGPYLSRLGTAQSFGRNGGLHSSVSHFSSQQGWGASDTSCRFSSLLGHIVEVQGVLPVTLHDLAGQSGSNDDSPTEEGS